MSTFRPDRWPPSWRLGRRHFLAWLGVAGGIGCSRRPGPGELKPRELTTNSDRLTLVRFSRDGKWLAAAGADGDVLVWRSLDDLPHKSETGRKSPPVSLTWSPDGLLTLTDLQRGFVGWQFSTTEAERIELPGLPTPAVCVAFRPNSRPLEMVIGLRDGSLMFLGKGGLDQLKPDHRGAVKQAAYSADGQVLVTAGADGQLVWREATSRKVIERTKAHAAEISRIAVGDDSRLATGDWNGEIQVWDLKTRRSLRRWRQSEGVSGLSWLSSRLVSGSWDGRVRIWNLSGVEERSFATGKPIHDLATDHQRSVATVGLGRSVQLWELPDSDQ